MRKNLFSQFKELPTLLQIAIVGGAYYGIYRGIKFLRNRPTVKPLPTGGQGIPATGYDSQGNPVAWSPQNISDQLFSALDGLFTPPHIKLAAVNRLYQLPTPDMLTAVYNDFNSRYGDGDTLTQWIKDELPFPGQSEAISKLQSAGLQ
jgi:hypothetical protein